MKSLIIWMIFLSYSLQAQTTAHGTIKVKKAKIYTVVDQMPVFSVGDASMLLFIQRNLKYPQNAINEGRSGTVYVSFVVSEDGSVTDVVVEKEVINCTECTSEALRVVRSMPSFLPGRNNGTIVKVQIFLPIRFILK
jgi:protein TonB